jgi:hypothetical protein
MLIDLFMSIVLLLLMAHQIIGEVLHEWFGAGMLILFIAHSILNIKWYGSLFKGKYTPVRIVGTVLNFAVLIAMLCLGYSGIVLSRHVFAFLPIESGMALSRIMHLAVPYWAFVLMSLHLGFHWSMVMNITQKVFHITKSNMVLSIILKFLALAVSAYGVYAFIEEHIADNMFLKTQFVFFDYDASAVEVFGKYIAMMTLFVAIGYYCTKLLQELGRIAKERSKKRNDYL